METKYTGPITRQRLADYESKSSLVAAATSAITVKPKELRDKVKLLIHELETNTVDSPHHWGWLHLRIKNLSTEECEAIVEGLKLNTDNVVWLNIAPINISLKGLACIIDSLKTNTRITGLHLHGKPDNDLYDEEDDDNYLIPVPTQSLVEVLKVNKNVDDLSIVDSSMTDDDVIIITDGLKRNTTVTCFHLGNNPYLTAQSAHYLSELIKSTRSLKKVNFIGKPNVNDEWAVLIASAMKVNRSVKELIMIDSQIGDEGARAFGEMLTINQTLTSLYLNDNQITDVGAKALADGLQHNSTLESLSIGANQLSETSKGGKVLLKAKNDKFTYLYL